MSKEIRIRNKRLTDEQFFKIRKEEVLPQWPTGKDISNLGECIAAAKEISAGKNVALLLEAAKNKGQHVLVPMFGRALTEYMIDGLQYVESEAALGPLARWLIFSDSYTRKGNFAAAQVGIDRSRKEGMSLLNGWPVVNFGVEDARKITRAASVPLHFNSTDEDGRLASEIVLAAGWSGCNTRSLQEVIAHCKDITLEEEIRINQYECRLAGMYTENGVPISPENSSNLTGYDAAGFRSFVCVSESLLAAEQGVRYQTLLHGLNMNLIQDVAMIRVTERLCYEYCARFGYKDMHFVTAAFPFLGAWPPREEEANAMVAWNAVIPILGGVTGCFLKCQDEALATPTKEGMAKSVRIARQLLNLMGTQKLPPNEQSALEEKMIELEVRALLEKCLEAGNGDIAVGLCKGVEYGWVDTMLTPWKYNHGKVVVMRDAERAVRYLDPGNLPLPKEVLEYHRAKIAEREAREGVPANLETVVKDLQFASIVPQSVLKVH